jgi:hypothetical protein
VESVDIIENEGKYDDEDEERHELMVYGRCSQPTGGGARRVYAYLIIIDSMTLVASSHLSVTISRTW